MDAWGTAVSGDGGLIASVPGGDWSFVLRRADLKPDARFLRYHGRQVGASDVALFVPHWSSLQWKQVPDNWLGHSESCAVDGDFHVTVRAAAGSTKRHEDVIQAFLRFMAG